MACLTELFPDGVDASMMRELRAIAATFRDQLQPGESVRRTSGSGASVELPGAMTTALISIIGSLALGSTVTALPIPPEVTTTEAAALLNVSRLHLVTLLESGEIPFTKVGTHRRIRLVDIVAFRDARQECFRRAMHRIDEVTEERGLPN
jgi:excisionase family DNA binding protein